MRSFPWDSIIIGKNEEYGYPIIDRPSSAEDLRELYKTFFSNGVFLNDEDAFQVTPGDGMNVIIAGGKCGIEGTIGYEAAPRGLAIQASSTTADRIDTVVLRWNNNVEVRNIDLYVKTGVAQSVPVRPTLTRSESVWELGIADIFVAKNSGAISAARITDTRLQTDRCGAVTPFMQLDTTTFFNQLQAQTQEAVDLAQSAIDGTLAGNLQSQIDANKEAIESNKETDDERWDSLSQRRDVRVAFYTNAITFTANIWRAIATAETLLEDMGLTASEASKGTFVPIAMTGDMGAYSSGFQASASANGGVTIRVSVSGTVRYAVWVLWVRE